ncbi:MAG: NADH-quinone oxidoreductase subunit N [Armatimonadetes bacterium]|nr:NADH-quinone oxidoreductase subunit N [Armatimonadota bacterium]
MPPADSLGAPFEGFQPPIVTMESLEPVMPVIILFVAGIIAFLFEMVQRKRSNTGAIAVSLLGLAYAAAAIAKQFDTEDVEALFSMAMRDRFGLVLQLIIVGSTFTALLFSEGYLRQKRINYGELYPLSLWAAAGAMVMVTTTNLLMIFLGLEVLSISLYVLAGLSRSESKSEESALKYFLLGAFASAFLLYGMALFYGATYSLDLRTVTAALAQDESVTRGILIAGLGLSIIGLGFKSGLFPFHQWTPDVYQGAPTSVTAFMAAVSKIAAIGVLYRVLDACSAVSDIWMPTMFWIAILTMTVGNLVALVQRDVKRVLAYSSIAHAGYLLVAVLAHARKPEEIGFGSTAFYLLAYSVMTVGAFAVISLVAKDGKEGTRVQDLNGLWKRSPGLAVALVIFMISLIGVPGTAGFIGKLQIFQDAVDAGLTPLAIVLGVNSLLSIAYYLRIAQAAFVTEEIEESAPVAQPTTGLSVATFLCAASVVLVFVFVSPISYMINGAGDEGKIVSPEHRKAPIRPSGFQE